MSTSATAIPRLRYADGHLNRVGALRKDPLWVSEQLTRSDARFVPVYRSRNLVVALTGHSAEPAAVFLDRDSASGIIEDGGEIVFLGLDSDVAIFAIDLSAVEEEQANATVRGEFVDLRRVGPLLPANEAALLAYARGMLYWHQQHRYCGRCGHATASHHGGHVRQCSDAVCGHQSFPRTDPAVIMLVEHRPADGGPRKCLLGRRDIWPAGAYSTLAGFVEPGESLEQAVAREVFEEVGVHVNGVIYQASQPWPFPASIMLGFRAQATSTEITVDRDELAEARWFTAEELGAFGEWGDEGERLRLPRKDSIARYLVDSWSAEIRNC